MTKNDICKAIQKETGVDRLTIMKVVDSFIGNVKGSVIQKETVYLRGFGTFTTKRRAAKPARIITRNQTIIVPEHDIPFFKPSPGFESQVKDKDRKKNNQNG